MEQILVLCSFFHVVMYYVCKHQEYILTKFVHIYSKHLCLDDNCNNNLNGSLNNTSNNSTQWLCSGDTSLVEPEILEDMGVSMLEDEAMSYKRTRKSHSLERTTLPTASNNSGQCGKLNNSQNQEYTYSGSSFDTVSIDRFVF